MQTDIASAQSAIGAAELETLLALVRGGTLAQAAARLGADGSTVFRTVQRTERVLGQRLFERSRQGYRPTEAMLALVPHAENIESALAAARGAVQGAGEAVAGTVRLTTVDAVLRGLVLPCLPSLAVRHPLLRLSLSTTNDVLNLTHRDADIALRATDGKPPEHLIGRLLGTLPLVACAGKALPAAQRRRPLEQQDWITVDEALPNHPSVRWRKKHLPRVVPRYAVDSVSSTVDAVLAGLGVGVVPAFMLPLEPRLVPLTEPLEGCASNLWLLAHPESRHLRRIAAVYAHFAEVLRPG